MSKINDDLCSLYTLYCSVWHRKYYLPRFLKILQVFYWRNEASGLWNTGPSRATSNAWGAQSRFWKSMNIHLVKLFPIKFLTMNRKRFGTRSWYQISNNASCMGTTVSSDEEKQVVLDLKNKINHEEIKISNCSCKSNSVIIGKMNHLNFGRGSQAYDRPPLPN